MDFKKLKETTAAELRQYNRLAASADPAERAKAAMMKKALAGLPARERDILEQMFISKTRYFDGTAARLQVKYGLEHSVLYRVRSDALLYYMVLSMAVKMAQGKGA